MKIYNHIYETIGNTPLVRLHEIEKQYNLKNKLIAKVESFNPAGSIKDRIALAMIEDAKKKNLINDDTVIIEPTSGNTGIGLAMVGASMGYKVILTMPDTMSVERRNLLQAYGATIVLTEGAKGMKGAIEKAKELAQDNPNSFIPFQFENMANPLIHYKTTAREIYDDLDGNIDIFVAGVGTGGTISGIGKYLKEQNSNIQIVAVEPENSPVLSKGYAGKHNIQGIGAGFVPKTLNVDIIDKIICVKEEDAYALNKLCAQKEGLLIGISSAAAIKAAIDIAKIENNDKTIVVLLPDSGERYLSTPAFKE